jgi:pimeloyl-ACP methyl ester carboxylesterase
MLAYDTAGAGDPPMIFVHGWSCDRSYFAPQFAHFASGHAVVALDLRGHGGSGRPDPAPGRYDMEVLAGDVLTVAEAAGLARPVLVGHSLGALIGLVCAARAGAVSALVMVDPAPITNEAAKAFFRDCFDAVAHDDDGSWRTAFVNGMFLPTDVARRAAIVQGIPGVPPGIAAALMQAMGEFDGVGALGRLPVPVLSIGSAVPSNAPADLRRACPAITIGQTVGAGHFNQLEVPEQVNAMIERFMVINGL